MIDILLNKFFILLLVLSILNVIRHSFFLIRNLKEEERFVLDRPTLFTLGLSISYIILSIIDGIKIYEGWDMFESDSVSYKPSNNNKNYFMLFPKNPKDVLDVVISHAEHVINVNVEKENKLVLLRAKIEELKTLFTDKPLKELEKLKFVFESITEPTLEDISKNVSNNGRHRTNTIHPTNIELPPKNEVKKELEKEEGS